MTRSLIGIGFRTGMLEVVEVSRAANRVGVFKCKCDCGNEPVIRAVNLKQGSTKSCGCWCFDYRKSINGEIHPSWKGGRMKHGKYIAIKKRRWA